MKTKFILSIVLSACLALVMGSASADRGHGNSEKSAKHSEKSEKSDKRSKKSKSGKHGGKHSGKHSVKDDGGTGTTCTELDLVQNGDTWHGEICGPTEADIPAGYLSIFDGHDDALNGEDAGTGIWGSVVEACYDEGGASLLIMITIDPLVNDATGGYPIAVVAECELAA